MTVTLSLPYLAYKLNPLPYRAYKLNALPYRSYKLNPLPYRSYKLNHRACAGKKTWRTVIDVAVWG